MLSAVRAIRETLATPEVRLDDNGTQQRWNGIHEVPYMGRLIVAAAPSPQSVRRRARSAARSRLFFETFAAMIVIKPPLRALRQPFEFPRERRGNLFAL